MPRYRRLLEDGRYYHITSRGNDRKKIFRINQDYIYFIRLIKEGLEAKSVLIHHYCFMNNHIHFLINAKDSRLTPKFFQILFQRYAHYFRNRYNHVGYLFQNRYKSYLIEKDSYLLECARYIERNPVRAGLVTDPADYKWSSYLYYACGKKDDIITVNPMFNGLATDINEQRKVYVDYVLQDRPYEHIIDKGLRIA